jgi:hypothetical protein
MPARVVRVSRHGARFRYRCPGRILALRKRCVVLACSTQCIDVQVFKANYAQARRKIFVVGNKTSIENTLDKFGYSETTVLCHGFQHVPKGTLKRNRSAVAMQAEATFLRDELVDLCRGARAEHVIEKITCLFVDCHQNYPTTEDCG